MPDPDLPSRDELVIDRYPAAAGHPAGRAVKGLAGAVALLCVALPLVAWWGLARLAPGRKDGTYQGFSQLMSMVPGLLGTYLRRAFYRWTLTACGPRFSIGFGTILATPDLRVGTDVYIGAFGNLSHCDIGDDTMLGSNVIVLSGGRSHGTDRLDLPMRLQAHHHHPISIGRDVWIGNGAIVMADIGDHVVVGAGAVVVKPAPSRAVLVGNPARVVRWRGGAAVDPLSGEQ